MARPTAASSRAALVTLVAMVTLAACAPAAPTPAAAPAAKTAATQPAAQGQKVVLKASHSAAPTEPYQVGLEAFKAEVEKATNGQVEVQIFPSNQLGNERDVTEGVKLGTVHVQAVPTAILTNFVLEFAIFDLPMLWKDRQEMYKAMDGELGKALSETALQQGFRVIGWYEAGVRHIMTRNKPINTIADLRGLKIRTIQSQVALDAFQAFGANPTPIAYGELYSALQQGVVDGAEAANTNYVAQKFYEVAPYWAEVGWWIIAVPVIMNEKTFSSLPKATQDAILTAGAKSSQVERENYQKQDAEALQKAQQSGAKITITRPDRAPFIEASKKVWKQWESKVGADNLRKIVGDY
jgi:tripartite ATP-independent transporter DctP family solute receptor